MCGVLGGAETVRKDGIDLKVGDKIKVWWRPGYDVIESFRPHPKYDEMFNTKGARIAKFSLCSGSGEMTIGPEGQYEVIEQGFTPESD